MPLVDFEKFNLNQLKQISHELADEIHMLAAITIRYGRGLIPDRISAKVCELVVPVHNSKTSP